MLPLQTRSRLGLITGTGLAALLLAPLLGPGYVLVRDMAFVPRTPIGGQLLGLDGVPRGVPSELVIALASRVVGTGWLQDLVLVAIVVTGAWGAARLAPTTSRAGAAAAATTYGWSAYLHERLLLGQWALLVGWAVLPWAVRAALDWRRGATGWWAVAALSLAALAGANALLLVGIAVVVCGKAVKALAATAVLSLPWVVPGLLQHVAVGDPHGVGAFAANADVRLGVLASLLTGGGVWSADAVPDGRNAGSVIAVVVLLVGVVGLSLLRRRLGNRLVTLGAVGLALSVLGYVVPGALRWAVVHVPAAGLLRDGQRFVALLEVLVAAAVACGVEVLLSRIAATPARRVAAVLLVLAPIAALPGAAWAENGRLTVSHYPSSWEQVTRQAHGSVVVLPWTLYRAFPWTDGTTVLDPATKLLEHPVVNDALPLIGVTVHGEDPLAARLDPVVRSGQALRERLAEMGISQVLVEKTTQGYDPVVVARQTRGLAVVADTPELTLYAVGAAPAPSTVTLWPVVAGDVAALLLALTSWVQALRVRRRWLPEP